MIGRTLEEQRAHEETRNREVREHAKRVEQRDADIALVRHFLAAHDATLETGAILAAEAFERLAAYAKSNRYAKYGEGE